MQQKTLLQTLITIMGMGGSGLAGRLIKQGACGLFLEN